MSGTPVFEIVGLVKRFGGGRRLFGPTRPGVLAVDDVDLTVSPGQTVGVVGESGSGKSTLARTMIGLHRATSGTIRYRGVELDDVAPLEFRRAVQYVFQDPFGSLNPRKSVGKTLAGPLRLLAKLDRVATGERTAELLDLVGLRPELIDRYPHELSGGQRQRVGIARALATGADTLILDEPVSALDVSVQAQVLALLRELQGRMGLTYVFISHDLAVVESLCDEVAVMYRGRIVEHGQRDQVFSDPSHAYTRRLLAAVPVPGGRKGAGRGHPEPGQSEGQTGS